MAEHSLRRHTPEVGAGCLNWARPDLCGGRGVTCVPTAIYAFDLWAERWRRHEATGDMIIVRYADDSAPRRREEEVTM
jgi:hypothetical protein